MWVYYIWKSYVREGAVRGCENFLTPPPPALPYFYPPAISASHTYAESNQLNHRHQLLNAEYLRWSSTTENKNLFQVANDLLEVIFRGDSLNGGDHFPSRPLLNANVAETLTCPLLVFQLLESIYKQNNTGYTIITMFQYQKKQIESSLCLIAQHTCDANGLYSLPEVLLFSMFSSQIPP